MAKARRRAGISVLIMLLGFMTIAFAIVYRITMMSSGDAKLTIEQIAVPAGASVVTTQFYDGMIAVTFENAGQTTIRLVSEKDGEHIRDIPIVAE